MQLEVSIDLPARVVTARANPIITTSVAGGRFDDHGQRVRDRLGATWGRPHRQGFPATLDVSTSARGVMVRG